MWWWWIEIMITLRCLLFFQCISFYPFQLSHDRQQITPITWFIVPFHHQTTTFLSTYQPFTLSRTLFLTRQRKVGEKMCEGNKGIFFAEKCRRRHVNINVKRFNGRYKSQTFRYKSTRLSVPRAIFVADSYSIVFHSSLLVERFSFRQLRSTFHRTNRLKSEKKRWDRSQPDRWDDRMGLSGHRWIDGVHRSGMRDALFSNLFYYNKKK